MTQSKTFHSSALHSNTFFFFSAGSLVGTLYFCKLNKETRQFEKIPPKMGKPKAYSAKAKKLAKKKGLVSKNEGGYSIDDVLDKAEDLMDEYNYELAQKFCQKAMEMNSDHPRALELSAGLLLEMGKCLHGEQFQHHVCLTHDRLEQNFFRLTLDVISFSFIGAASVKSSPQTISQTNS